MKYKKGDKIFITTKRISLTRSNLPYRYAGQIVTIIGFRNEYYVFKDGTETWELTNDNIEGLAKITNWKKVIEQ